MKIIGRIFFLFILPVLLLGFWIAAPVVLNNDSPLLVMSSNYSKGIFRPFNGNEIHVHEKVSGQFKSKENNLGIVAVRFNTFGRINNDIVIFRIKESNNDSWYYEGKYKVDQFQPNGLFTFGFPRIPNSENKSYLFEIESTKGEKGDAVALSYFEPSVMAKYAYSKSELFRNKKELFVFSFKKIAYSYQSFSFFISSLPFLLPLVFYSFLISIRKRIIKKKYPFFQQIFTFMLLLSLVFLPSMSTTSFFLFVMFWVLLIIINRLDSSVSFLYSLVLLLITPFLIVTNQQYIAENFARWTYYFFAAGTFQLMYELKMRPKEMTNYKDVINDFIGEKRYSNISKKVRKIRK